MPSVDLVNGRTATHPDDDERPETWLAPLAPANVSAVALPPGTAVEIIKRDPDGDLVVTYPGVILPERMPKPWVAVEAWWVNQGINLDGLVFATGARLVEYFSPIAPFNCFAVYDPDSDALLGWYANVTHPTQFGLTITPPTITWRDLYLDIVGLPNGHITIRDEDELSDANLLRRNPALHTAIVATADLIVARLAAGAFPFHGGAVAGISRKA